MERADWDRELHELRQAVAERGDTPPPLSDAASWTDRCAAAWLLLAMIEGSTSSPDGEAPPEVEALRARVVALCDAAARAANDG